MVRINRSDEEKMKKKERKKAGARELNTAEWIFALFALVIKKKVTDAKCNFGFVVLQFSICEVLFCRN
jgi:hypothetical protein